jgi:hypothetical protein
MTLPNFLIIGAAKAATTSLYQYLRQHPDVYMSPVTEPAYYASEGAIQTREEYERLFDGATSQRAIGEASPQYLNDGRAPGRIAADLRDVRLIVSLRNPVDRAYSSYLGRLAGGSERRSVDEAMRRGTYYFDSSLYHAPLSRYFDRFDRNRIKVMLFDDLVADARAAVQELCAFLDIERDFAFDATARYGAATAPRSIAANAAFWKVVDAVRGRLPAGMRNTGLAGLAQQVFLQTPDPLPASIRQRLLADFRDDIIRTEALIGRRLSCWLE